MNNLNNSIIDNGDSSANVIVDTGTQSNDQSSTYFTAFSVEVIAPNIQIFKEAIENAPTQDSFEIYRETVSLKDQKDFILKGFKTEKVLSLKKLVKKLETKIEIIVTFLALLEMIKQSEIICLQKENFKDIEIKLIIAEA